MVAKGGLLFLLYFLTARIGLKLDAVSGFATLVWPPTGIALAALLLYGPRLWPGIFLGATLVNWSVGAPFPTACGIGIGNTLEALIGATLLKQVRFDPSLQRLRDVLKLALLAAVTSTMISATLGVTTLWASGIVNTSSLGPTWRAWWIGDMLGALVVAPFLLTWGSPSKARIAWDRLAEGLGTVMSIVGVGVLVFGGFLAVLYPSALAYLIFPPLIWAALRFGPRGAATAIFATSLIAITGTTQGLGPFTGETLYERLLLLQLFMGVISATTLILASVVSERRASERRAREKEEQLRQARDELEIRIEERTRALERANQALRAQIEQREKLEEKTGRLLDSERTKAAQLERSYLELKKTQDAMLNVLEDFFEELNERKEAEKKLKATQLHLIQAAKMESVGRLAAGVAHEVKNPLAVILQGLSYLSKHLPVPLRGEPVMVLNYAKDAVRRADTVIRGLLDFSTQQDLAMSSEDIGRVLDEALTLVKHELDKRHVELVKEYGSGLPPVWIDKNKIEQVFVNLFINAAHAMSNGGILTLRTLVKPWTEKEAGMWNGKKGAPQPGESILLVEVEDTGTGIPEELLPKIFDPFFTTKPTGMGTGLGLAVTKNILEMHQGSIDVRNRDRGGVRVSVLLKVGERRTHGECQVEADYDRGG